MTTLPAPGRRLRRIAAVTGALLLLEAVALAVVLALLPHAAPPLPAVVHLRGADGRQVVVRLAAVRPGWAAVVLLVLGAAARLAAVPRIAARCAGIARNRHAARWWEWSFTLPIVVFLVAQLNGIAEVPALVPLYAITAGAVLVAALQELLPPGRPVALMLAAAVGIVPWGVIAFAQVGAGLAGHPPSGVVRVVTLLMLLMATLLLALVWREQARAARDVVDARGEAALLVLGAAGLSVFAWTVLLAVA